MQDLNSDMQALEEQAAKIIDNLITIFAIALVPFTCLIVYFAITEGWGVFQPLQLSAFCVIWFLAIRKDFLSPRKRAVVTILFLMGAALSEVLHNGLLAPTFAVLAVLPLLVTAIGGLGRGMIALCVVSSSFILVAWVTITYETVAKPEFLSAIYDISKWVDKGATVFIASTIGVFVIGSLYKFHVATYLDLRERNRELSTSRWQNREATKLAELGHATMTLEAGQFVECDTVFAEMHGRTPADFVALDTRKALIAELIHIDDQEAAVDVGRRLILGEPVVSELRYKLPNGKTRYLRKSFSQPNLPDQTAGFCHVICQDVTETRLAQEKLFQAQKMDAIGKLTGGVAHDFNNLLAVILGNLELAQEITAGVDQKELIQNGIDATLRGAELTRNMLSFAQQAPLSPTRVELNQLIGNLNTWISRTLPTSINVAVSLPDALWPIEVDASSVDSAFLNLILNARDAMPNGGQLTIETSNVNIGDDYLVPRNENIEPGRYVLLAVSDTGEGISAENLKRVFEPFFTTKPVGSGSGLGLSMLEGFMRQSGGTIRVYSELGVGTTFKLYFKAMPSANLAAEVPSVLPITPNETAPATILVVEDNLGVLEVIKTALEIAGFKVIAATSGDSAFKVFQQKVGIDLLLTDIVMPGELQGTTLAKAIRATQPDFPVVFMSGYANEATVHGNGLRPEDIRLMKPVGHADLLNAINKALARRSQE